MSIINRPITYQVRRVMPVRRDLRFIVAARPAFISSQPPAIPAGPITLSVPVVTPAAPPADSLPSPILSTFSPVTSIVVPVLNESENVLPLVTRIYLTLKDRGVEIFFVDDSRDMLTVEAVEQVRALYNGPTFEIDILHRAGEDRWGGLSGAVTDGMRLVRSNQVIIMDGDLQHPPETIPAMLDASKDHDVVVASRYCVGGDSGGLNGRIRHMVSRGSTQLTKIFFPKRLRGVTDPMTGFFLVNKSKVQRSKLRPKGFKILLEILATHPELTKAEVPFKFAERAAGESHGTFKQGLEFFAQLLYLRFSTLSRSFRHLPKVVQFGTIGGSVFAIGMALLYALVDIAGIAPLAANAIQLAFTFWLNYILNRHITWRARNVSQRAAYKFLISRATTTTINYFLFAWLISLQFAFTLLGTEFVFAIHYLAANVISLIVIMGLNYEISDRWAFAEPKVGPPTRLKRVARVGFRSMDTSIAATLAAILLGVIGVTLYQAPAIILAALLAASSLVLFIQASIEAWRMTYSYRDPESVDKLRFPKPRLEGPHEWFCMIVPARHESEVLMHTLSLLARQTHPDVDIITVVCDDDTETLEVAYAAAQSQPRVQVIEYPLLPGTKPSKPLQLNYAFERTADRGYTVFGVIDAEDTVHPELLLHVEAAFRDSKIDIVQGGVQLMNHDSSWYSLHNVLEYYRWFNSAMAYQADKEFMPLGGNTIFIRNAPLRQAKGWPVTLTEDCSLGVLLSTRFKAKTAVYYDPRLATREETPGTLGGLFKQRVRWNQGFFHEWRSGVWRELPSLRQRLLASYVLLNPVLLALISIFMAISLAAIFLVKAPVALAMIMYLPLVPVALLAILHGLFLYDFGKAFDRKVKLRHYGILFTTQVFYQIVLNTAALWAVIRELRGVNSWYKTPHSGLHRGDKLTQNLQPEYATAAFDRQKPEAVALPPLQVNAVPYSDMHGDDRA